MTFISKITSLCGSLLLTLCLLSCISETPEEGTFQLAVGDRLPRFAVTLDDGTQVTTDSLRGRCGVIAFFHTQCPDCQREFPVLQRLYDAYADTLTLFCISREEGFPDVSAYWTAHQLTLPFSAQTDARIYHLFASRQIPRVYISDRQLRIQAIFTDSPVATYDDLEQAVRRVLSR